MTLVSVESLSELRNQAVRVQGEGGNWRVLSVDGENCLCRRPNMDIGSREEVFHHSLLTLAPPECENKVCPRRCGKYG